MGGVIIFLGVDQFFIPLSCPSSPPFLSPSDDVLRHRRLRRGWLPSICARPLNGLSRGRRSGFLRGFSLLDLVPVLFRNIANVIRKIDISFLILPLVNRLAPTETRIKD